MSANRENRGHTLMELLIVSAIIALVSLAIYSCFNNGLRLWQRLKQPMVEEDTALFFEKLWLDLENILPCSEISFEGKEQSMSFPGTVGRISYYWDKEKQGLNRREQNYSQLFQGELGLAKKLANNITDFCISYLFHNTEKEEWLWKNSWTEAENLPLAVRVEVGLKDGSLPYKLSKTISIPIS